MKRWVLLSLALCLNGATAQITASTGEVPRLAGLDQQAFLQLLVARSVEVQYSQLNTDVTRYLMKGEAGLYETNFVLGMRKEGRNRQRTPDELAQNFATAGTPELLETGSNNEIGIRNKLPWGTELSMSYRVVKKTNNLIPQYNKGAFDTEYNTALNLTLKQPLLRNAGRSVTETDRRVAELEHQISLFQLLQQIHKISIDGLSLYWQLYRAQATLELRESAYASTQALLADAKARIAAGKLPASSVLEVQGVLLNRQAEVTRSQQALREAQGKLSTVLSLIWDQNNLPVTRPRLQAVDTTIAELPSSPEAVLEWWPPYQIAQIKMDQALVRLNYAKNQMLPAADFVMGYSGTGYNYLLKESRLTAEKGSYPDWYFGVNIELPMLGNQKAQQQFLAQSTRLAQAELEISSIKNSFLNDLAVRHSDLQQARAVLLASQDEVALRQTLFDNERQRHELGVGLLGALIQKQVELTEARQRLLENQIRFEIALATWNYTQGSLLKEHQIEIAGQVISRP